MAYGIHFGLLLICSVAEHLSGLRDLHADGFDSQRQNGYRNVGFSQEDAGQRQLGGSYILNKFRQASIAPGSAQNEGSHRENLVKSAYSQRPANRGYTQTSSQRTPNGDDSASSRYPSGMVPRSSYGSAPVHNPSQHISPEQVKGNRSPPQMRAFGLSTSIASGSSVSARGSKKRPSGTSKSVYGSEDGTRPTPRSTLRPGQYQSSSYSSFQSPSRESYHSMSTSHQSSAQNEPYRASADSKPASYYGQKLAPTQENAPSLRGVYSPSVGYAKPSPRLFTKGGYGSSQNTAPNQQPNQHQQSQDERRGSSRHVATFNSYNQGYRQDTSSSLFDKQRKVKVQSGSTSASAPGRRVPLPSGSQTSLNPSAHAYTSKGHGATSYNPSHSQAAKLYQSQYSSSSEHEPGIYRPTYNPSALKPVSVHVRYVQSVPASNYRQKTPATLQQPGSPKLSSVQRLSYSPSYTSTVERLVPSSASSGQNHWVPIDSTQEASSLPASNSQSQPQSGRRANSGPRIAPSIIHSIPEFYGGSQIRRLRYPVNEGARVEPQPAQPTTATHSQKRLSYSQQRISYSQQAPRSHQEIKWMRIQPRTNVKSLGAARDPGSEDYE